MRRCVVIGLGAFGGALALRLAVLGHRVVGIDKRPDVVDALGAANIRVLLGDFTRPEVLRAAGADSAGVAVVCIGDDLAASMLTLIALRDLGIEEIFVEVHSREHQRLAEALGAATIFPEKECADALASRISTGGG